MAIRPDWSLQRSPRADPGHSQDPGRRERVHGGHITPAAIRHTRGEVTPPTLEEALATAQRRLRELELIEQEREHGFDAIRKTVFAVLEKHDAEPELMLAMADALCDY